MNTGEFSKAVLCYLRQDSLVITRTLKRISMRVNSSNFAEFVYYVDGIKTPENKRFLVLPVPSIFSFEAEGYAN